MTAAPPRTVEQYLDALRQALALDWVTEQAPVAAPENVATASWRACSALKPMPVPASVMASKK